jgi:tetratricopeptide (TPR) repeat protein
VARLAAARARRKPADKKRTAWEVGEFYWNRFATLAKNGVAILAVGFVGFILWQSIFQKVISISPISVPKELADEGYTPDVAAERLEDALNEIVASAHSLKRGPDVAGQADLPSIVVPSTSLSTEAVAAQMRRFFHYDGRWNVSGEITRVDKKLWLRLRMNGHDIDASAAGEDRETPDDVFMAAAQKIFEESDPYVLAVFLSKSAPGRSLEIAKQIVSNRPESDPLVPWAHILAGNILLEQQQIETAVAEYKKAIELDPRSAPAHTNLGSALNHQGKTDEAIAEYKRAIQLDPFLALAHDGLGSAYINKGMTDEAIAEWRKSVELDPRDARAHVNLCFIFDAKGKAAEAIVEGQKATELDPYDENAHNDLGLALADDGRISEAVAEYRKAIEIDPRDPRPHFNLGLILTRQGKNDDAKVEFDKARIPEQKP